MPLTLVVEDGTGKVDSNTYVSVADADAHNAATTFRDVWTFATADLKAQALADATRSLDENMEWLGYRAHDTQALDWPRQRVPNRNVAPIGSTIPWSYGAGSFGSPPFSGIGAQYWPTNVVPPRVIDAVCELAVELMKRDRTAEWGALGVSRVGLGQGALDVSFESGAQMLQVIVPDRIGYILLPYGSLIVNRVTARVQRG
jgi:hypothetical protein